MVKLIISVSIFLALSSVPGSAINLIGMPGSEQVVPRHPRVHPSKSSGIRSPRTGTIDWQPWVSALNFRYRTGCRYTGGASWERYLDLESTTAAIVRLSGIRYGNTVANDVGLSPASPSTRLKLVCGPLASWSWDVTVYQNQ